MADGAELGPDDIPEQTVRKHAKPVVAASRESVSDHDPLPDETGNGSQFVSLMRLHPFMALLIYVAKSRYPTHKSDRSRVEKFIGDHAGYYKACWVADFILTVILVLMLLAVLGLGAWKTLFGSL